VEPGAERAGELIWERAGRVTRGAQPSLSYERIAAAGVEIADAEGLEAVSMRKIAARLGAGTMSLYRYVSSKDDLVELMFDHAIGAAAHGERTGDWRADLAEVARDLRRVMIAHPWLAGYQTARPTFGPNLLAVLERTLGTVDGIGLDIDGMVDMWLTVLAFVQGYVQAELAEQEAQRRSGLSEVEYRARVAPYIRQIIDSGRYPLVARLVLDAEDFPDPDRTFERRLGYVLDGLAGLLR
jgi:AcrR family transcriptional regulator